MLSLCPMPIDRGKKPDAAEGPSSLLALLRAGQIDVETFIERKIDAATAHLRGLSAGELEQVRALLREQIAEEPELQELVRRASGG